MWALYALAAALLMTAIPLVQEKFKADGTALALWVKIFSILFTLPFVAAIPFPTEAAFYLYVGASALLYSVSDVIYFRNVPIVGSGIVTRILPASVVITFFMWFLFEPELIKQYLAQPEKTAAILVILALFVFFASRLKQCPVSWAGVRLIWFVIFAACTGPLLTKASLKYTAPENTAFLYVFTQALFMVLFLGLWHTVKKPVARAVLFSRSAIQTGAIIGGVLTPAVLLKVKALALTENPAYVTMIFFTDALWVLLVYRLIKKREHANIWAGLGIVACAAAVVLVKSL